MGKECVRYKKSMKEESFLIWHLMLLPFIFGTIDRFLHWFINRLFFFIHLGKEGTRKKQNKKVIFRVTVEWILSAFVSPGNVLFFSTFLSPSSSSSSDLFCILWGSVLPFVYFFFYKRIEDFGGASPYSSFFSLFFQFAVQKDSKGISIPLYLLSSSFSFFIVPVYCSKNKGKNSQSLLQIPLS